MAARASRRRELVSAGMVGLGMAGVGLIGVGMISTMITTSATVVSEQAAVSDDPEAVARQDSAVSGQAIIKTAARTANPFVGRPPFAAGYPAARRASRSLRREDPAGAAVLRRLSQQPIAHWLGPWYSRRQVTAVVKRLSKAAARQGRTAVFVTYALPARDCNGHSGGGLGPKAYRSWTKAVAAGLKGRRAVVIVEPDALAMLGDCSGQGKRTAMLRAHVRTLKKAGAVVYLDAGHSNWRAVPVMARRLKAAGVGRTRGFAVNVANFGSSWAEQVYAERLSAALGGKHYVIDTSRNGRGRGAGWCNPAGRALGATPRAVNRPGSHLDAYLWIKTPGLSDGECNGGPPAGTLWPEYAISLARRAGW